MNCPECNGETKVVDRRSVRRRRECLVCKHRFSTVEMLASEAKLRSREITHPIISVEEKPKAPKAPKPKGNITVGVIKRNADARRKIEEIKERKRIADDFDFFDDDFNYLPDKW